MGFPVTKLLLVICVFHSFDGFEGQTERCPKSAMVYHEHTRSCFEFMSTWKKWNACYFECGKIHGGVNKQSSGHLARILDKETDAFLKKEIGQSRAIYWMDLNDATAYGDYKFGKNNSQKYNIKENYTGWEYQKPQSDRQKRYVVIYENGWMKYSKKKWAYCLCQVKEVVPPVMMTSRSPMKVGSSAENAVICTFDYYRWTESLWKMPNGTAVVRCIKSTEESSPCTQLIKGYSARLSGKKMITLDIANVHRRDEGTWKCDMKLDGNIITEGKIQLQVYESATEINCHHVLSPKELEVTCVTPSIYPRALCQWEYKDEHGTYQKLPFRNRKASSSDETCTINLGNNLPRFVKGERIMRVAMYPMSIRSTPSSTKSMEHAVSIVKPNNPVFKCQNGTTLANSITVTDGGEIYLQCIVDSGTPKVYQTDLECEFDFTDDANGRSRVSKIASTSSTSLTMHARANIKMDGKSCKCIGNHMTGSTQWTTLQFKIEFIASISQFTSHRSDINDELQKRQYFSGVGIDLACYVLGNPAPTVIMRRAGVRARLITTKKGSGYPIYMSHTIPNAKCADTGEYYCEATNTVAGIQRKDNQSLNLDVLCEPSLCSKDDDNKTIHVGIGDMASVKLCMYANPMPIDAHFSLEYNGDIYFTNGYKDGSDKPAPEQLMLQCIHKTCSKSSDNNTVETDKYTMNYVETNRVQGELSINFSMTENTFGTYHVQYKRKVIVYFNVIHRAKQEDNRGRSNLSTVTIVPCAIVIILVIGCAVVVFLIWKKKRQPKPIYTIENVNIASNTVVHDDHINMDDMPSTSGIGAASDSREARSMDLIYTMVTFDVNKKVNLLGDNKPRKPKEEPVEHTTLDFIATKMLQLEIEEKERQGVPYEESRKVYHVSAKSSLTEGNTNVQKEEDKEHEAKAMTNPILPAKRNDNLFDELLESASNVGAVREIMAEEKTELVYTTVTFDANKKVKLPGEDQPKRPKKELVEYTTLDFIATKMLQLEIEEKERQGIPYEETRKFYYG